MVEVMRKIQPAFVTGVGIKIGKHFIHAAEFSVEHLLSLRFVELQQNAFRPRRKLCLDFERGAIARVPVSIAQSRERFVQRVPGRPHAVEIKRTRANISLGYFGELLPATLEGAQIAVAILVLHFLHLFDKIVRAVFESRIAGRRVH